MKIEDIWYVYVLKSVDHYRFYVGISEDVDKRLKEHNSGKTKSTKGYKPWELFMKEKYPNRKTAREREIYLKSGSGKEKIKQKWSRSSVGYLPADAQASVTAGREQQPSKLKYED